MKMRLFFVVALVLLFPFCGLAQETEKQMTSVESQTNIPAPVTGEDLQKMQHSMQNALDRMRQEVRQNAEQTEIQRQETEKKQAEEKETADNAAALARAAEEKRLDGIAAQAVLDREALVAQHARAMLALYIGLPILLIAIVVSAFVIVKKRGQKIELVAVAETKSAQNTDESVPALFQNPEAADLEEFTKKYGLEKFTTILTLHDGREGLCHVRKNPETNLWQAQIDGDRERLWINWKDRRKRASRIFPALAIK